MLYIRLTTTIAQNHHKVTRKTLHNINCIILFTRSVIVIYTSLYVTAAATQCRFPGAPAHSNVFFSNDSLAVGTVATYACERGFELLGPARRVCGADAQWTPEGIPFCGESFFTYHECESWIDFVVYLNDNWFPLHLWTTTGTWLYYCYLYLFDGSYSLHWSTI